MKKQSVSSRIHEESKSWYGDHFQTVGTGTTFILESFPEFYKRAFLEIKGQFTREELLLIVDVYNATLLTPGMPMLGAQVEDGIALDGLDKKWEIDGKTLVEKIKSLTSFQQAILEILANGYWYGGPEAKKYLRDREGLEKYVEVLL